MAEMWKPKDRKIYLDWILNMRANEKVWRTLTDWEQSFCHSLHSRLFTANLDLTQPQADKLESIYAEKSKM